MQFKKALFLLDITIFPPACLKTCIFTLPLRLWTDVATEGRDIKSWCEVLATSLYLVIPMIHSSRRSPTVPLSDACDVKICCAYSMYKWWYSFCCSVGGNST